MCGIVGKLTFDGSPASEALVQRMRDLQVHRGPDAAGSWALGPVALGQRRLSIIDLSPAGEQPMGNEDGSIQIVFNGEIYNFQELRAELVSKGHAFRSDSDTEVIVHLYEEMGPRVVERLRGMFAFALWDGRARRLMLARDRVGKKPLFYHVGARSIVFASEVRSLFADPEVPRTPDYTALHHYLTYQYVPSPLSGFENVASLDPACYLLVGEDGSTSIERYWSLDYREKLAISEAEAVEQASELILEATRLRMIADVPLGAFLSGGVDSSVVVAAMARQSSEPVKTFTIGFKEQSHNEAPYARRVAEEYGTDHTELVVEPHAIDVLPKLVWHYGNPFADSSALPSYYVAEITRRHVTVALNGDGGDESFAGYTRYADFLRAETLGWLPRPVKRAAFALTQLVPHSMHPIPRKIRNGGRLLFTPPEERYAAQVAYFQNADKHALYTPEFAARMAGTDSVDLMRRMWEQAPAGTDVDRLLWADVSSYLPDDLLVKVDIATMANSLEARSPLLDQRVMEFAARLPAEYKLKGAETKYLLKKVAEQWIPREVIYRPKMGFGVPIADWFRGELQGYLRDVLLDDRTIARGMFERTSLERLIDIHVRGESDQAYRLWALLMLELWFRTYIDRSPADGPL